MKNQYQNEWKVEEKWDIFLENLDDSIDFDKELKGYLRAIKKVSQIKAEDIDKTKKRTEINKDLEIIVDFIEKYKEDYYEIGLIKGFKMNDNNGEKIEGRDYYYYIADQKMKASVYYVRYRNYIDQEWKDGIDHLKYMLFNNMMREIRFIGAAYQRLWYWKKKKRNLFRYVSYDGEYSCEEKKSKKKFFEDMFANIIDHMNASSKKLCSYSEDPYVDIFKYLKISKDEEDGYSKCIFSDENLEIDIRDKLENENTARFDIIKDAQINSVYRDGIPMGFYDFVQDGKDLNGSEHLSYAVEIYPDLSDTKKNNKNTPKHMKEVLFSYLATWSDTRTEKLRSYVADDKEVVTLGSIENAVINVNQDKPNELSDRCRYTMTLAKPELIYLILKLRESSVDDIINQFKLFLDWNYHETWLIGVIKNDEKSERDIDGRICMNITDKKYVELKFKCKIKPSIIQKDKKVVDTCKREIQNKVEEQVQTYFKERYNSILNEEHRIADFILEFIEHENLECPSYISEYNEFEPEKGDIEISMLKYLVFKRG